MRLFLLALPVAALSACAVPALNTQPAAASGQQPSAAAVAGPFTVPIDPGTISCASLSNPTALMAATDWALGKARGATLAGTLTSVPQTSALSGNLASYCSANPTDTVRGAARRFDIG